MYKRYCHDCLYFKAKWKLRHKASRISKNTFICPFLIHRKPPANSRPYFLLLKYSIFVLVPFASLFCVFSSSFNKKMQMKKGLSLAQFSLVLAISLGHCTRACWAFAFPFILSGVCIAQVRRIIVKIHLKFFPWK